METRIFISKNFSEQTALYFRKVSYSRYDVPPKAFWTKYRNTARLRCADVAADFA
jgi:hypothetical protein